MTKEWFVGTSGFMVGQKTWLDLPGLNCIEINSTFYRLPNKSTIAKWKNLAPDLFFSIKASKYITHMKYITKSDINQTPDIKQTLNIEQASKFKRT